MKALKFYLIFILINAYLFIQPALCQNTVFIDVNVVPMDSMYILENYDVVIEDGVITEIGPTGTVQIPAGAQSIPGSGKYLMPGLVDMHVHVNSDSISSDDDDAWGEEELILFLANGVTTIRNMWGDVGVLQWREQVENNELFGPTIYSSSPIIDGNPPIWPGSTVITTTDDARAMVIKQKQLGYDYIKVYNRLSLSVYDAIIDEAYNQDIPVIGHVPWNVGLEHTLAAGQYSIEHFQGYSTAFGFIGAEIPIWENIDSSKREVVINATIQSGVWNCPTMAVYKNLFVSTEEYYQFLQRPNVKYVPQILRDVWIESNRSSYLAYFSALRENTFNKKLVKALHQNSANLIIGTDCINPFVVPGFSIHEELLLFVEAGLTPYETIKAGTYNAAKSLKALDEFGTIANGKRADLILTNNNPLVDVANIQDRVGVMARGNWYTAEQLNHKLDVLAQKYSLYVNDASINRPFQKPGFDTLAIAAQIANPYNLVLDVKAHIKENNGFTDSLLLVDDGTSGDISAGDGTYSGLWPVDILESIFTIHTSVQSVDSGYYYISKDSTLFTTIGPIHPSEPAYIDTNYNATSNTHSIFLILQNYGSTVTAQDLSIKLSTEDLRVKEMVMGSRTFPDLSAGEIDTSTIYNFFSFKYADGFLPDCTLTNPIQFDLIVSSDGYPYWTSSFNFVADKLVAITDNPDLLPKEFALYQNYPNPFNPITNIKYKLPKHSQVDLSIFNILGQKVATLVSQKQLAGSYQVEWDASGFSSGVYIYKISTDQGFSNSKKLLLIK